MARVHLVEGGFCANVVVAGGGGRAVLGRLRACSGGLGLIARTVPYSKRLICSEPPRLPLQVTSVFKLPPPQFSRSHRTHLRIV